MSWVRQPPPPHTHTLATIVTEYNLGNLNLNFHIPEKTNEKISFSRNICMGATSSENYHSQKYLYAYQWGLGYNDKLLYQFKAFHYEGKCETFMVKTTPVTHTTRAEQISSDGICSCNKRWSYNNWKFTMHVKHRS